VRWIEKPDQEYLLLKEFREEASAASETFRYGNFRKEPDVVQVLANEQQGLCAYTMRSLQGPAGLVNAHVEHIVPQSQCESEGTPERALDYLNLMACYRAPNHGCKCPFGAEKKADTKIIIQENFISPLQPDCESRFSYEFDGKVTALTDDTAAQETIRILNLNEAEPKSGLPGELARLRRATIESFGLSPLAEEPLTLENLEVLKANLTKEAASPPEYVIALRQCLDRFRNYLLPPDTQPQP